MRTDIQGSPPVGEHQTFRTTCGRQLQVGRLALASTERRTRRVSLDIGPSPGRQDGTRAALTPAEARQLAAALLRQAAAAEPDGTATAGRVEVSYLGGQRYEAATRGHSVLTDQPAAAGGDGAGMTPPTCSSPRSAHASPSTLANTWPATC